MNSTYVIVLGGVVFFIVLVSIVAIIRGRKASLAPGNQHLHFGLPGGKSPHFNSDFILETIEDGVVTVGLDGVITMFNPGAVQITGWPAEEAIGMDYKSVLVLVDDKGEAYQENQHPFAKTFTTAQVARDSKGILATRNNKRVPVSMVVSPVLDDSGSLINVIGVLRNITSEKAEEKQRSDFVSTASHEMRTPIAAIEGYLALALNEKVTKLEPRARSYIEKAHSSTQHLGQLFADLLTSSKAEDGRLASYPVVVELGEILQAVADSARFNAQKKGLELKFIVSSNAGVNGAKVIRPLFYGFVDPNRLREVMQNLVDNAIKYTAEGTISVAITGNTKVIQMQVSDTGAGIPAEDISHLFQKFYRVDSSMTRTIGGTGLGLFICRKILELYNGRIWVTSQLGKGSTFYVNLPRLTSEQALEMQRKQSSTINPNI